MVFDDTRETVAVLKQRARELKQDPKGFTTAVGNEMAGEIRGAFSSTDGAYMYPIKGLAYFLQHPDLYRPITGVLFKGALASLAITIVMFFFTYVPQAAVLSLFATPVIGFPAAVLLVLAESWLIVNVIVKAAFIEPLQDNLFDRVMVQQGYQNLVARAPKKQSRVSKVVQRSIDRFSPAAIARYLLTLPLNFIPLVGPAIFFLINGRKMGESFQARYFQLKGWEATRVRAFEDERKGAYTVFGAVALGLQMIPILGMLFAATSTVGAALWAADMEKSGEAAAPNAGGVVKDMSTSAAPLLREQ